MRWQLWMTAAAVVVAVGLRPAQPARAQRGDGWVQLFNGKNLDGWTVMNKGDWAVENGILKYTGGGNGWLRSNDKYADFHVITEWRFPVAAGDHDSGFFFRAGLEGNPWPSQAYQLNMGPKDNIGSVGGIRGADKRPDLIKAPGGEWNTFDLTVTGDHATCQVNGKKAWDATGLAHPEGGYLGWEGEGYPLDVKSVRVMRMR